MSPLDHSRVTLAILAGGKGSRMGMPKAELKIAGVPILKYLLDAFDWPGPTLLVTAPGREHPTGCELFDAEAVDPVQQGPLRGILTALENSRTEIVVVATVDMPCIRPEQILWMIEHLDDSIGIMSRTDSRIEPFPFLCKRSAYSTIESELQKGYLSVHALLNLPAFAARQVPSSWPAKVWANLNFIEDIQSLMKDEPPSRQDAKKI